MSGNLLINQSFEDPFPNGPQNWQTSGPAAQATDVSAFEQEFVAQLGPVDEPDDQAIVSQIFRVPDISTHLHISWAMKNLVELLTTGELTVQIQWFGSANIDPPNLPLLGSEVIFIKQAGAFAGIDDWETAVAVTNTKPDGTLWARIRFILEGVGINLGEISLDYVVVTGEQP